MPRPGYPVNVGAKAARGVPQGSKRWHATLMGGRHLFRIVFPANDPVQPIATACLGRISARAVRLLLYRSIRAEGIVVH